MLNTCNHVLLSGSGIRTAEDTAISAIARCRLGDENSKRAISEASLRFTLRIAEQWSSARFGRIIGDVVEEANAALWNSIDEFNGQRLEEFELFLAQ